MKKRFHIFICLFLLIVEGCTWQQKDGKTVELPETKVTKWKKCSNDSTSTDTVILMYNEAYNLKIKKHCLNDSLVVIESTVREDDSVTTKLKTISHNYSYNIILSKGSEVIFDKKVIKEVFKDSFGVEFKNLVLSDIRYKYVRTNRLYFTAKAKKNQTYSELEYELDFAIFYKTNKIGKLDYWGFRKYQLTY